MLKRTKGIGHKIDMENHRASLDIDMAGSDKGSPILDSIVISGEVDTSETEQKIIDHLIRGRHE